MSILTIDGSQGEGGGQIVRSSLALAIITGTRIRIENIRARRARPGLMRQHLTAVTAAAEISGAEARGATIGSTELEFRPGPVRGGTYRFAVGTAGSACLVLQTVLPALLMADTASTVAFEGGTHNPLSPPFDFIAACFVPVLGRMGADVSLALERPGFYPAGGGRFTASIAPWTQRRALALEDGGPVRRRHARALISRLRPSIGHRELQVVKAELGWATHERVVDTVDDAQGPGNVLLCTVEREHVTEMATGFGERGVPAEEVARRAVAELRRYLDAGVAVGEHLADQLLIPLALAGGCFRTLPLSLHAMTNLDVIRRFLRVNVDIAPAPGGVMVSMAA